jgi:hypothetical protein
MVRYHVATSQARDRLLDAAVEHALSKGIVDLSLREIAAALGTSHRMIIYHFGSREGLLGHACSTPSSQMSGLDQDCFDRRVLVGLGRQAVTVVSSRR